MPLNIKCYVTAISGQNEHISSRELPGISTTKRCRMISGSFLRDPDHAKGSEEHLGPKRNTRKRPLAARAYEVRGLGAWERLTIQTLDEKKTNVITCSLNSTLHSGLGVQWRPVPLLRGFRSMGTGDRAPGAEGAAARPRRQDPHGRRAPRAPCRPHVPSARLRPLAPAWRPRS